MEPLRDPQYILGDGIKWSLVMSLAMLIGGAIWLATLFIVNKRKNGKLIGSANGDPYGIKDFVKDTKEEIPVYTTVNMMCKLYPENYEAPEVTAARLAKERAEHPSLLDKIKNAFNKKDGK
jgi:hypothetical protein